MEVIVAESAEAASATAARLVAAAIRGNPKTVLSLATGSTPIPLYEELIRLHRDEGLDFSGVATFNLDEYIGLPGDHPCSYRYFMDERLFRHINIRPENVHIPDGMAADVVAECADYEARIEGCGGIDIQIAGIGGNGHIGFNEPGSSLGSRTRIKTLAEQTQKDNARFFASADDVPMHCITMGVGTITASRRVILLAFGERKAEIVARAVEGPVTASVPASVLQMHPDVKVFIDEAAASRLERRDYYGWVYRNKPEWQRF